VDYLVEFGFPQVFEYREAGLKVVALAHDGQVDTVFVIEDKDTARLHTAARTGRTMSMRYVKTDGSVSLRKIAVGSVKLTKGGFVTVRATDLKIGEDRTFRADRMTHTTLHRTVAAGQAAPSKTALAAAFVPARPAVSAVIPAPRPAADEARTVRLTRSGQTGRIVPGSRARGASGWSVKVELDDAGVTASGTVRVSEDELEDWVVSTADVYRTTPGTAAALEAPEAVQDRLAEAFALGREYAFVTV
jgi:hypothetical protein